MKFTKTQLFAIGLFVLLLVSLPVAVFLSQQRQDIRPKAAVAVPTVVLPTPNIIPNCANLSGPATLNVGQSGTYTANYYSAYGKLSGTVDAGQNGAFKWSSQNTGISGTSGPLSFTWTPTAAGTYDVFCRAWNDAIAECRGNAGYVDGPPRYSCRGPNSSMTVVVLAYSTPTPVPVATYVCPFDCQAWNPAGPNCAGAQMNGCGFSVESRICTPPYTGCVLLAPTVIPPSPIPTKVPAACNNFCNSDSACGTGYCYQPPAPPCPSGINCPRLMLPPACRNRSCPDSADCNCSAATPTPVPPTATPTPIPPSAGPSPTPPSGRDKYTIDIGDKQSLVINIGAAVAPQIKFKAKLGSLRNFPDMYLRLRVKDELAFMNNQNQASASTDTCNNPNAPDKDFFIPVKAADGVYSPVQQISQPAPSGVNVASVSADGWVILDGMVPGRYYTLYLKGPKTRKSKMAEHFLLQPNQVASQDFDWTATALDPGDLPDPNNANKQDCTINSTDWSIEKGKIGATDGPSLDICDVNYDGMCNAGDSVAILDTLSKRPDDDL